MPAVIHEITSARCRCQDSAAVLPFCFMHSVAHFFYVIFLLHAYDGTSVD